MPTPKPTRGERRTWGMTGHQLRCAIYAVLACLSAAVPEAGLPTLLFLLLMDFVGG